MTKKLLALPVAFFILMTGCQQGPMGTKNIEDATHRMTKNESLQKAFSDGRIHVMKQDLQTKRSMLQNTLYEQKMMIDDPDLSEQFLRLNIDMNQLMMNNPTGEEQLTKSTLKVMDTINKDSNKLSSFIQIQDEARKKAIQDDNLRERILQQNLQEQSLALSHPATSTDMKELSLRTTNAILNDKELKNKMLSQNIQAFSDISSSPSLRSEMADAMLPLLKDPKISNELENMIKLAVAKETQKLQAKLQQLQKMQQQKLPQQKMTQQSDNASKIEGSDPPTHDKQKQSRKITEQNDISPKNQLSDPSSHGQHQSTAK